jgi:hypothetical protein
MLIAVSTLTIVVALVIVVLLGLISAPFWRRSGAAAERTTPLGTAVPKLPDREFRRPPSEGG